MEGAASVTDPQCCTDFLVEWLQKKVVFLADPQPGYLYRYGKDPVDTLGRNNEDLECSMLGLQLQFSN